MQTHGSSFQNNFVKSNRDFNKLACETCNQNFQHLRNPSNHHACQMMAVRKSETYLAGNDPQQRHHHLYSSLLSSGVKTVALCGINSAFTMKEEAKGTTMSLFIRKIFCCISTANLSTSVKDISAFFQILCHIPNWHKIHGWKPPC